MKGYYVTRSYSTHGITPQGLSLIHLINDIGFIAGGYARKCALPTALDPNDIDIYARNKKDFDEICNRIITIGRLIGITEAKTTPNSRTFIPEDDTLLPIQVIKPVQTPYVTTFGTPETVLNDFSYTTEQFALTTTENILRTTYNITSLNDTGAKRLRINHISSPITMFTRYNKYAKAGYTIPLEVTFELLRAWDGRPKKWRNKVLGSQGSNLYELLAIV